MLFELYTSLIYVKDCFCEDLFRSAVDVSALLVIPGIMKIN